MTARRRSASPSAPPARPSSSPASPSSSRSPRSRWSGIPFLTAMGLAAAATVFVAVLVALTLLPAILGLTEVARPSAPRCAATPRSATPTAGSLNNGVRWARLVGRAPVAVVVLVVVGLGAIALPLKSLHLAFPTDSTAVAGHHPAPCLGPGRRCLRRGSRRPAAGRRRRSRRARRPTAPRRTATSPRGPPGRTAWSTPRSSRRTSEGTGAQVLVTPATGPDDTATEDLLTDAARRPGRHRGADRHHHRRHRADRHHHRRLGAAQRRAADLPRGRHRAGVPAADARVPLDPGPAHRDPRLPALGPGHPRRDRRGLPGGRLRPAWRASRSSASCRSS